MIIAHNYYYIIIISINYIFRTLSNIEQLSLALPCLWKKSSLGRWRTQMTISDMNSDQGVDEEIHISVSWSGSWARWPMVKAILWKLQWIALAALYHPDNTAVEVLTHSQVAFGDGLVFELQREPLSVVERSLKRVMDIVVSSLALITLSPIILFAAVLIRADSPGPILFHQVRSGFNRRQFRILKFRTMCVMEDGAVIPQATRKDTRVTRVGRLFRRTSIDELPQLLNVLLGDMSIVGPRPHALAHDIEYTKLIANYPRRHHMEPGITGWAQVNGFRGQTPELTLMRSVASNWTFGISRTGASYWT